MTFNGFGIQFLIGDGGTPSESFTAVAEVQDCVPPTFSKEAIDVTHHGSTDGWREFLSGLKDGGEVTLTLGWLPQNATHDDSTGLLSHLYGDDVNNYQIILPDTDETTFTFAAVVTGFEGASPLDAAMTADVTLKVSGKPTIETGASA
jgi:predicted secreted protein